MSHMQTDDRQYIQTSDRGTLRRLDAHDLGAAGAAVPGASESYPVRGQALGNPVQQQTKRTNRREPRNVQQILPIVLAAVLAVALIVLTVNALV